MTDRELLEAAAKAAGVDVFRYGNELAYAGPHGGFIVWNPLADDGDALRLAVELGIDISLHAEKGGRVYAQSKHLLGFGTDGTPSYQAHEFMKEEYNGDPLAATRRAIVRAAAEIGRSKE